MADSNPAVRSRGLLVCDESGRVVTALGEGSDRRLQSLASDRDWLQEATAKRFVPIHLTDKKLTALVSRVDGGTLIVLSGEPSDTLMRFFANVDFASDIIDHVLTDPYDAMVVVDSEGKLAFISPVHEKFFGLSAGEGTGKNVRDVIHTSRLAQVVRTGVAEVGQVFKIKGSQRVVSRHPIRHKGKIVGAIGRIMFSGPQQVEELARKVRDLEEKLAIHKQQSLHARGEEVLSAIIGKSVAIQSVREQIRKVAPLDLPVLIQGPSGTGKELVARALHMLSPRFSARMVTVNAAALPPTLVESELFGYEAGSFTGADRKGKPGKFELADKGTIFLDEIGDMPIEVQSKLLRVLQDWVVERVGGDRPTRVDFRLCSATNRDLQQLIDEHKFRLDLFYRISPVCIIVPSLEERTEDIPLLLHHFVQEFARKYAREIPEIDVNVPDFLMARKWPGNIRQLEHEIQRAFVFCEGGRMTTANFIQQQPAAGTRPSPQLPVSNDSHVQPARTGSFKNSMERMERDLIDDAMLRFRGNKRKVAADLGISRSYLYKKLGETT